MTATSLEHFVINFTGRIKTHNKPFCFKVTNALNFLKVKFILNFTWSLKEICFIESVKLINLDK